VWDNEFFNRSVRRVVDTGGVPNGGLPQESLRERKDGTLVDGAGNPYRVRYALASQSSFLAGRTVASDRGTGELLVRVDGPLVVLVQISGLYPQDVWSGKHVTYTRRECTGGYVSVVLQSDRALFSTPQLVTATAGGRRVGGISVPPTGDEIRFLVPLEVGADGMCTVRFTSARTLVPAHVEPGSTDKRALGTRFLQFEYLP
jgi:hypothetical protein